MILSQVNPFYWWNNLNKVIHVIVYETYVLIFKGSEPTSEEEMEESHGGTEIFQGVFDDLKSQVACAHVELGAMLKIL